MAGMSGSQGKGGDGGTNGKVISTERAFKAKEGDEITQSRFSNGGCEINLVGHEQHFKEMK